MEIIYHERRPNVRATVAALEVGDQVIFSGKQAPSAIVVRVACSQQASENGYEYSVNKTDSGIVVTRNK